jgi:hypothetical protein
MTARRLTIVTPYGNRYAIHGNGDIGYANQPDFVPSGQWKMLGIVPVRGGQWGRLIPLGEITPEWLAANPLLYKNGKPRFTVADLDHGTRRIWGNTRYHGIERIYFG